MLLNSLINKTFRASSTHDLVELSQLNQSDQQALAGLASTEDIFGIFKNKSAGNDSLHKIAYKDVALLSYFLKEPSQLPSFIKNNFDDDINATLCKLVLEGILEIQADGEFVSGVDAQNVICPASIKAIEISKSRISQLSEKAIQYGIGLNNVDGISLSTRLYCYNTIPSLSHQYNHLDRPEKIKDFLWKQDFDLYEWAARKWMQQSIQKEQHWLSWTKPAYQDIDLVDKCTYKLYISPLIQRLPEIFVKSVKVLSGTKCFSFKVGATVEGLLRPDKLVAYFLTYKDLNEAVLLLKPQLPSYEPQGVPFTSQLDDMGILSWGLDPPKKDINKNIESGSWRERVTKKIALSIIKAKKEENDKTKILSHVMSLIALEDIDPETWTPKANKWNLKI